MKKFSKVLSVLLALTLVAGLAAIAVTADGYQDTTGTALPGVAEGWTRYEAENGEIFGSNKTPGVDNGGEIVGTEAQNFYSGGMAAGGFEDTAINTVEGVDFEAKNIAYVKFTVNAASAGETDLTIAFNGADPDAVFVVQVNDGEKIAVACPASPDAEWNRMGTATTQVTLQKGENTVYVSRCIELTNTDDKNAWRNIDFIDVKDLPADDPSDTTAPSGTTASSTEPTTTTTTFPQNGVRLTVDKVQGNVGDVVEVPIYVEENSRIASFTFTIKYDPTALEAVKMETEDQFGEKSETYAVTEIFSGLISANVVEPGQLKVAAAREAAGITNGGKLIIVSFKVLDGFEASSLLELDVEAIQTSEDGITNIDAEPVRNTDGGVYVEIPTEPTTPTSGSGSSDTTTSETGSDDTTTGPSTGDSSNITLYLLLAGAAVVVMAGSVVALKKAQAK